MRLSVVSVIVAILSGAGTTAALATARAAYAHLGVPATTPRCRPSSLIEHGGRQGAPFESSDGEIAVTNTSDSGCYLIGTPSIALLRLNGKQLPVEFAKGTSSSVRPLLLKKGQAAGIVAYWFNWCGPNPGPLEVRLDFHGVRVMVKGPFNGPPGYDYVPGCSDKSRPSTIQIVSGFHIGSGLTG